MLSLYSSISPYWFLIISFSLAISCVSWWLALLASYVADVLYYSYSLILWYMASIDACLSSSDACLSSSAAFFSSSRSRSCCSCWCYCSSRLYLCWREARVCAQWECCSWLEARMLLIYWSILLRVAFLILRSSCSLGDNSSSLLILILNYIPTSLLSSRPYLFIMNQPPANKAQPIPPLPSNRHAPTPYSGQQSPRLCRQPHLARTSSNSVLSRKQLSSAKSTKQHEIQKVIRYNRSPKQETIESSVSNSQTKHQSALLSLPFEDSTQTIQRVMHYSTEKSTGGHMLGSNLRGSMGKASDVLSGASRELQKSRVDKGSEDYYLYWKSKAHEYLQANMKLMEDNRRLNRENEELREQVQTAANKRNKAVDVPNPAKEEEAIQQLRKVSQHYLGKLEAMEKELKKKEVVIVSYQQKLTELTRQLSGDSQRVKLLAKMREDIQRLQSELKPSSRESLYSVGSPSKPSLTTLTPKRLPESKAFPT